MLRLITIHHHYYELCFEEYLYDLCTNKITKLIKSYLRCPPDTKSANTATSEQSKGFIEINLIAFYHCDTGGKMKIINSLFIILSSIVATDCFVARPTLTVKNEVGMKPLHLMTPTFVTDFMDQASSIVISVDSLSPPESDGISYSRYSYYTVLGLYLMSFPGLWSIVKRSTAAKVKRKTYVSAGENAKVADSKSLRQQAGEIMAYMKANNYEVAEAGGTITFRGVVQRSLSQAFFLTFCTALGLLSLALVLQIQFNDLVLPVIGEPNWFYIALTSPYAGLYYWRSGDRVDECSVKLTANEDETENEITVQGSEDEIERMWRTMNWTEKGMVKIEGMLG